MFKKSKLLKALTLILVAAVAIGLAPAAVGGVYAAPAPAATYAIGPGRQYASLTALVAARGNVFRSGAGSLQAGNVVEIYPNIQTVGGREVNVPYEAATDSTRGFLITVSGTASAPIAIRGVADAQGRRPILERATGNSNMVTINGNYIVFENIVVDGGLREFIEWLNGQSASGNRFGANTRAAFAGETVTLENFHTFIKRTSNASGGALFSGQLESYMRTVGQRFARRGIYHEGGNYLTVRNCLSVGSGTGLTSADVGPGSILVERCEFAFNGISGAWHNVYLNGDNAVYQDLVAMFRNNYVHHSLGSMGFRSRVGRTILMDNFFWDNGVRHADLICTQKDDDDFEDRWSMYREVYGSNPPSNWWWADRFTYREDHEIIGNVFVNTANYNFGGIRLGGAMPEADPDHWMETSLGRYRVVNNTFVHLANTGVARAAVEAQFGVESIEMYNNVFYSNQPSNTAPFWDQLNTARINQIVSEAQAAYSAGGTINPKWLNDDGSRFTAGGEGEENANTWRFGVRQVAGANNWVSYGSRNNSIARSADYQYHGGVPFEWTNTTYGTQNENPFVDSANFDFRLKTTSTANRTGSPVGSAASFMTQAEYNTLRSAGRLPLWETYHYTSAGRFVKDIGANRTVAPWKDLSFPNPTAANTSSPPLRPATGANSASWTIAARSDSAAPTLGAYALAGGTAPTPTYTATVSPSTRTFPSATAGYSNASMAQVFTITNTGNQPIVGLSATLGGQGFEISTALSANTIPVSGTATIAVRPRNGLAAGAYSGTLTIRWTSDGGTGLAASLSFTVSNASLATPALTISASPAGSQTYPGNVVLTATLSGAASGNSGKPIVFTVNGSAYSGTTNASGVATYTVASPTPGTYSFGASFAGDAGNSAASAAGIAGYSVGKAAGASVTKPAATGITETGFTASASLSASTGQAIQYAVGTSSATPGAWQTSPVFTGLSAGTTYYIFARSAENANYRAGASSVSDAVRTLTAPTPPTPPAPGQTTYNIADFYTKNGQLSVKRGDIIIVGQRQYKVLPNTYTISYWSQNSLNAAIAWWTDYMNCYVTCGVMAAV